MMSHDNGELECRVCRSGEEENRPLIRPCLCTGSIGYVHQDCLETWLSHSNKQSCELCSIKYEFEPLYAADTPKTIPIIIAIKSIGKIFTNRILPSLFRIICAFIVWLILVPLGTTLIYSFLIRGYFLDSNQSLFQNIWKAICYGIVMDGIIALSVLIVMSFSEFLRVHWNPNQPNQRAGGRLRQRQMFRQNQALRGNNQQAELDRLRAELNLHRMGVAPQINNNQRNLNIAEDDENSESSSDESSISEDSQLDQNISNYQPADEEGFHDFEIHEDPNNVPLDPDDLLFDDINEARRGDAGADIRNALMELIGINGPFHLMFTNALWLKSFCALYILVVVFPPNLLGLYLFRIIQKFIPETFFLIRYSNEINEISIAKGIPFRFLDFFQILGGAVIFFSSLFSLNLLIKLISSLLPSIQILKDFSKTLDQLSLVIKVGVLLVMRIFLMPITLGSGILTIVSKYLVNYSLEKWFEFVSINCVGAFGLAWVTGITFMLSMTISVLQLREVLHPSIFGKLIKPQEAHKDLIGSLIKDEGLAHAKRLVVSFGVYSSLVFSLIFLPLQLYTFVCINCLNISPYFDFKVWYFIPESQLPLELLLSHITFLTILDGKKELIGHFQYNWLKFLSYLFGIERFLLPFSISKFKNKHKKLSAITPEVISKLKENEDFIVSADPVVRPPPKWDVQAAKYSTRWSWIDETPSMLENTLAPQLFPTFYHFRVMGVLLCSFVFLVFSALGLILLPISIGRGILIMLFIPNFLHHDPVCFYLGFMFLFELISFLRNVYKTCVVDKPRVHWTKEYFQLLTLCLCERAFTYFFVGCIVSLFFDELDIYYLPLMTLRLSFPALRYNWYISLILLWVRGLLYTELGTYFFFSQSVGTRLLRWLSLDRTIEMVVECRQAFEVICSEHNPIFPNNYIYTNLTKIEKNVVTPLFTFGWMGFILSYSLLIAYQVFVKSWLRHIVVDVDILIEARTILSLLLLHQLLPRLYHPFSIWYQLMYTKIRDEYYLIGRRLMSVDKNANVLNNSANSSINTNENANVQHENVPQN